MDTDSCIFVAKFCLLKSKLFCVYDCGCNLPVDNMLITELQHMVHRVAKTALIGGIHHALVYQTNSCRK